MFPTPVYTNNNQKYHPIPDNTQYRIILPLSPSSLFAPEALFPPPVPTPELEGGRLIPLITKVLSGPFVGVALLSVVFPLSVEEGFGHGGMRSEGRSKGDVVGGVVVGRLLGKEGTM
jgi:hypothetical protein